MSSLAKQDDLFEAGSSQSGIGPSQWIKAAVESRTVWSRHRIEADQVQPASLDLRLGEVAHRVTASFLPGRQRTVADKLGFMSEEKIDLSNGAVLRRGHVYIVELQESLRLRRRNRVSGAANPKSSTGRLDVFARLITDYGVVFDAIPPGYTGPLWLEIAPRSFDVRVRTGSRLAQLRLLWGVPPSSDSFLRGLLDNEHLVWGRDGRANIRRGTLELSVDVVGNPDTEIVGYKAKNSSECIDIDVRGVYDPQEFWEPVIRPENGGLILNVDDFHILATKERIALPPNLAADMVAYDTLVGEFRVHYAGFFDPGFGYTEDGAEGAKIVLEVRSHEVPFMIEHGQVVGGVMVQRLTEATDKPYGAGIGSSYQRQGLALSKQFKRSVWGA